MIEINKKLILKCVFDKRTRAYTYTLSLFLQYCIFGCNKIMFLGFVHLIVGE